MTKKLPTIALDDVFQTSEEENRAAPGQATTPPPPEAHGAPFENSELAFSNTSLSESAMSEFSASLYNSETASDWQSLNDPDFKDSVFLGTVKQSGRQTARARRSTTWWVAVMLSILVAVGVVWMLYDAQRQIHSQQAGAKFIPAPVSTSLMVPPTAVTAAVTAPVPAPSVPPVSAPVAPALTAPQAAATPAPVASATAAPPITTAASEESARVREAVENWRQAWAAQDVTSYLGFYSPDFVPAHGQSRAQWEAARRKALARPDGIELKVTALRLRRIDANQVKVEFLQDYSSGSYREVAQPKNLLMVRNGPRWLIQREWQGRTDTP